MSSTTPLEHDQLVHLIYDCAESPAGLHDALQAIAHHVGADKGHTLVLQNGAELADHHFCGYDAAAFGSYDADWRAKDPRFAASLAHQGRVLSDVAIVEPGAFERSEIYNEFLARVGVRYTLFTNVEAAPDLLAAQAFMRDKNAGPFGPEEVRRLTALMPHLTRAIRLRHLVRSLTAQVDDLRQALDSVPGAVTVLDRSGKLLAANASAETLLATSDGLRLEKLSVTAAKPAEARALFAAIAQTAALADARGSRAPAAASAATVTVTREQRAPLAVVLFPLRPRNPMRNGGEREARVLAVFHDPEQVVRLDAALVAQLHELTPTEAALAVALAEGKTLAQFAEVRGCTEQTARTHLKRVLDKTGTSRQPDLVRVLLTGAAVHRVG